MSMETLGGMISTGVNSCFFHQTSLAFLPAESSSSKAGGAGKGNDEFCLSKYPFHTWKGFQHVVIPYCVGPTALLPLRKKAFCGFSNTVKNPSPSDGLEPENFVANNNYANY
jgi:hypothetical protein